MKVNNVKLITLLMAITMLLTACENKVQAGSAWTNAACVDGCSCTDCICCRNMAAQATEPAEESLEASMPGMEIAAEEEIESSVEESSTAMETEEHTESPASETEESDSSEEETRALSEIELLSEGEKAARREQQRNFAEARELLYQLKNSKDKTTKINQMDRQILANNSYDFSKKNVVFIGDSITEGITSAIDPNGNYVSYVTYADDYLQFQRVLNHGVGGRMYSTYGGEELSLAMNFGNVTNVDSDIIVVFAGVNDYLTSVPDKRFGNVKDTMSTAGYCGALRYFMKQLNEYYSDREIFFVTMYDISKKPDCNYSDYNGQPSLGEYMKVQRELAKEYGFHIIDLNGIGFMDCSSQESSDYYLRDGLHPKDNGNIVLGEHIAAELSLYFSQN